MNAKRTVRNSESQVESERTAEVTRNTMIGQFLTRALIEDASANNTLEDIVYALTESASNDDLRERTTTAPIAVTQVVGVQMKKMIMQTWVSTRVPLIPATLKSLNQKVY